MSVCYIYVYKFTFIRNYKYKHFHVHIQVFYLYVYIYDNMHTWVHICIYMCVELTTECATLLYISMGIWLLKALFACNKLTDFFQTLDTST